MIKNLKIKRYIFIKELDLNFYEGLNIFIGETGAGKSIILEAIQSLFHYRLTSDLIQEGESSAYLEGAFFLNSQLKKKIAELLLIETDPENQELVISREINKSHSKARINGRIVSVKVLSQLAEFLVDLHGQGSSYKLLDQDLQLDFLDSCLDSNHANKLSKFQKQFKSFKLLKRELTELEKINEKTKKEQDYLEFSLEEINKLNLENVKEESELIKNIELLSNLEERNLLIGKLDNFVQSEESFFPEIKSILNNLKSLNKKDPELKNILEQAEESLENLLGFLQEISYSKLEARGSSKIDQLNFRLSNIQKLKKKHRLSSLEELFCLKNNLENRIQKSDSLEKEIQELEQKVLVLKKKLFKEAKELSGNRENFIEKFSDKATQELKKLAFKGIEFKADLRKNQELNFRGSDQVEFQIRAKKQKEFRSLKKTVSGGELSRISLTLKCLKNINNQKSEQVVIFDEIDSGTSGQVSSLIGEKLFNTSLKEQVICITHQPLVACYADYYFFVKKEIKDKVNIQVKELKEQKEIIKALSALLLTREQITQSAQDYLQEIITQAKEFKSQKQNDQSKYVSHKKVNKDEKASN